MLHGSSVLAPPHCFAPHPTGGRATEHAAGLACVPCRFTAGDCTADPSGGALLLCVVALCRGSSLLC
eukprot:8615621-Lingulodinium_polyedra.AAC.1